jgi:pyridoxal 5'-phosphate synthase pdxS subunit
LGRLPVVNFAAGGVATPADAALMMVSSWTCRFFLTKDPRKVNI